MIVNLSLLDIISLQGSDTKLFRDLMEAYPQLKENYTSQEARTTDGLRASGWAGWIYVADLLEGTAGIPDSHEALADKAIKLGWIRKAAKEEYVGILKRIPTYLLVEITRTMNKELGIRR